MKLLFDENLSAFLPRLLADVFPQSAHLREVDLKGVDDAEIWNFAAANDFTIVTKDDDFRELSVLRGAPPKLLILTLGNCPTKDVERLLRQKAKEIEAFGADRTASLAEIPIRA